jgi:hypothetical protein
MYKEKNNIQLNIILRNKNFAIYIIVKKVLHYFMAVFTGKITL